MGHKCEKCGEEFSTPTDLERHKNRKKPCDSGDFPCKDCGHTYASKKSLSIHIRLGRCKGKNTAAKNEELECRVKQLEQKLEQQEHMADLVTKATVAATQQLASSSQNHVTVNINTLQVTRAVGEEDLSHISRLTPADLRAKLDLSSGPRAFARWCALVRADENAGNHNALLREKNDEQMLCCRQGRWTLDDRQSVMLELLRHDCTRLYNSLGRLENDEQASQFRIEYLLHNVMVNASQDNTSNLKLVMDAMAEPLIELTNKLYVEPVTDTPTLEDLEDQDQFEALLRSQAALEEQVARNNATLTAMRRTRAERAKRRQQTSANS